MIHICGFGSGGKCEIFPLNGAIAYNLMAFLRLLKVKFKVSRSTTNARYAYTYIWTHTNDAFNGNETGYPSY